MHTRENATSLDCTTPRMLAISQSLLLVIIVAVLYSRGSITTIGALVLGTITIACLGIELIHREDGTLIFDE